MAIKIIQKGKDSFTLTCYKCACVFSYELEDIGCVVPGKIKCPCCGEYLSHPVQTNPKNEKTLEEKEKEYLNKPIILQINEEDYYTKYFRPYTPCTPCHPSIIPEPYVKIICTSDTSTTTVKGKNH